jgi:hypothetical protein|uniref:Major capsid protein n=1 Tax=Bathycoccus sp. RCC716 virus 2 TaxID=2530039 RepID=A0A7S6NY83_9PHYC|nr:hypothetical protein [Bathycoccus sp. RCC716 virus 2]|tara:strand:+ start:162 stop:1253 length:1092 start_codon:yes stop_codon:yes gene_type:complete
MSAALIDLVSVGAQDVYITGDPQVSFFRQNYKRHTNFAIKPERLDYIGSFGAGNEIVIPIRSKGDLLSYVWLEGTDINLKNADTNSLFNSNSSTPTEFSLWIGGQEVCKMDSLFVAGVHNVLYNESQAKASCATTCYDNGENASSKSYVIPFFFSEDWTKSLPLVGLQYHEVEVRIKLPSDFAAHADGYKAYGSYVFLDTAEREFFANEEHEVLFTQTQFQPMTHTDTSVDLTYFNHPVKAVHIACAEDHSTKYSFADATMYINGTPLFENMSYEYYSKVVPSRHCSVLSPTLDSECVATWPFCLTMNKSQPTGTLNFSRIDSAKLAINSPTSGDTPKLTRAYAVNYNILRIKNGMGGVAFGN